MKIALLTNPASDRSFRTSAEACLAKGVASPADLQHCLRDDYPGAAVTDGIEERGLERWYAYREGRWVQDREGDQAGRAGEHQSVARDVDLRMTS